MASDLHLELTVSINWSWDGFHNKDLPSMLILIIVGQMLNGSLCLSYKYNSLLLFINVDLRVNSIFCFFNISDKFV